MNATSMRSTNLAAILGSTAAAAIVSKVDMEISEKLAINCALKAPLKALLAFPTNLPKKRV